jgi:hypothetical protein
MTWPFRYCAPKQVPISMLAARMPVEASLPMYVERSTSRTRDSFQNVEDSRLLLPNLRFQGVCPNSFLTQDRFALIQESATIWNAVKLFFLPSSWREEQNCKQAYQEMKQMWNRECFMFPSLITQILRTTIKIRF